MFRDRYDNRPTFSPPALAALAGLFALAVQAHEGRDDAPAAVQTSAGRGFAAVVRAVRASVGVIEAQVVPAPGTSVADNSPARGCRWSWSWRCPGRDLVGEGLYQAELSSAPADGETGDCHCRRRAPTATCWPPTSTGIALATAVPPSARWARAALALPAVPSCWPWLLCGLSRRTQRNGRCSMSRQTKVPERPGPGLRPVPATVRPGPRGP